MFILFALGIAIQPRKAAITNRFSKKVLIPKDYENGIGCEMCKSVIKYVEQLLLDTTVESEIATLVEQLCTTFPSPYDSLCKTVVESYLPTVLEWIEQGLDSLDICTRIGLCETTKMIHRKPNTNKKYINKVPLPQNDEVCDMCNELIQRVEQLLSNQTVEEEIKEVALQYCSELSWTVRSICKSMVNQYLSSFLEWLDKDIDSLNICTRIGVCVSRRARKQIHKPSKYNANACETCKTLVAKVKIYLDNSTVEEEIEENLNGYCSTLSWPMNDLCKSLVKQYIPTLIEYVKQDLDAETICNTLGYCTTTRKASTCQVCQSWFQWAEDKLDKVTVEGLWKLVSEECPKVPYLNYFCQTINEQNIEQFVSLILSNLPPKQCCEWVSLC